MKHLLFLALATTALLYSASSQAGLSCPPGNTTGDGLCAVKKGVTKTYTITGTPPQIWSSSGSWKRKLGDGNWVNGGSLGNKVVKFSTALSSLGKYTLYAQVSGTKKVCAFDPELGSVVCEEGDAFSASGTLSVWSIN